MSFGNLDLDGTDKLMQMDVFSDMFHKAAFGKFLTRRDGSFVLANNTLAYRLRMPEISFNHISLHELVLPTNVDHDLPFDLTQHKAWYENWFNWPEKLTLESANRQKPFQLWGFGACNWRREQIPSERLPHNCLVVIKPIYVREIGKMIVVDRDQSNKNLLAFGSVIFTEEFKSFQIYTE